MCNAYAGLYQSKSTRSHCIVTVLHFQKETKTNICAHYIECNMKLHTSTLHIRIYVYVSACKNAAASARQQKLSMPIQICPDFAGGCLPLNSCQRIEVYNMHIIIDAIPKLSCFINIYVYDDDNHQRWCYFWNAYETMYCVRLEMCVCTYVHVMYRPQ